VSGNNIHKEKLTNVEKLFVLKSEVQKTILVDGI
jgi:hypothetical protein